MMTRTDDQPALERGTSKKQFLYEQIAERIRGAIAEGVFQPGDRITSMDELAARYEVNKLTVIKAVRALTEQGVLYALPSKGTFVAREADTAIRDGAAPRGSRILSVGVVSRAMVPGETGFYHLMLVEAIRESLGQRKANLVLLPAARVASTRELVGLVRDSALDGVIYVSEFPPGELRQLMALKVPSVVLDDQPLGLQVDSVSLDNQSAAYQAMHHLIELGHRRIAIMTGIRGWKVSQERTAGAMAALAEIGLAPSAEVEGRFTREGGYEAAQRLFAEDAPPSAVFCMNDEMAIGLIRAAKERGLSLPDDLSVIGFDDTPLASDPEVQLTSVAVPVQRMSELAVERLLTERSAGESAPGEAVKLVAGLVIRGSTGRPRP